MLSMKVLTVVLAICMLSVIGCSNDNDSKVEELENQIKELQQVQTVAQPSAPVAASVATASPTPTPEKILGFTEAQWEDATDLVLREALALGYDSNQIPDDVWEQGISTGSPTSAAEYVIDWIKMDIASIATSNDRYDPNLRTNMVYYCMTAGSGLGYCTCSLEYVESRLTQEEYIILDTKIVMGQEMSDKEFDVINGARSTCPIDSPKYSQSIRTNFAEACAANGGPSEYCSCALEYLEYQWSQQDYITFETMLLTGKEVPVQDMQIYTDSISMCSALFVP
ncbi:MAG: hypothetical protein CL752_03155 [Chloroflexi bacterium]|nr:hypothetical protein [Chloroflexota bacterium]